MYLVVFHLLKMSETTCFITVLVIIEPLLHQERPTETVVLSINSKVWYWKLTRCTFLSSGCECYCLNITLIHITHSLVEKFIAFWTTCKLIVQLISLKSIQILIAFAYSKHSPSFKIAWNSILRVSCMFYSQHAFGQLIHYYNFWIWIFLFCK